MSTLPSNIQRSARQQAQHVLETGQRFKRFDQLRQRHFWSSYYFAQDANGYINAGRFPLFTIPIGQTGQGFPAAAGGMTMRETNWSSSNRVPDNQNFEITEIGVSLGMTTPDIVQNTLPPVPPDVPALVAVDPQVQSEFLNNTVVSITYLTNSVPLGLACDFAQASAPHVGSSRGNTAESQPYVYRSNGFAAPSLRRKFKIPILLQHGETFSFAFEIPRAFFIGRTAAGGLNVGPGPFIARFDFWATESFVEKS